MPPKKRMFARRAKETQRRTPQSTSPATAQETQQQLDAKPKLKIIPLGGMEEVGRNMTVFEYGTDILVLDMGLQFPEDDMPGINYIVPNVEYLKGKESRVRAVLFSHAHLDHVGAAPILLEQLKFPPVVGRPLTLALLKRRQYDYDPRGVKNLKTIAIKNIGDVFTFGALRVRFFQVEHSIMDAVGVIVETPDGSVIHLGDWTMEKDERGKALIDYSFLADIKHPSVLMGEALGVTDVRPSTTAPVMKRNLNKIISEAKGRVIIATFASQIERIDWIISAAERYDKKVALDGYSMKTNIEIAKDLGYVKAKKDTLIKMEDVHKYPDHKLVIIITGAQGEENAAFSRAVSGYHRHLKMKKSDTVIFSSSVIPGNEHAIQKLKDEIYRQSDHVIHNEIMDIHVSGHANREDNISMLGQIKPDYYIPTYAYHYMLCEAAKLAEETGIKKDHIVVLDDGQIAEFDAKGLRATNRKVPTDHVFVDGAFIGDASGAMLNDRKTIAEEGVVITIVVLKNNRLVSDPDIVSRGFIYMKDARDLVQEMRRRVRAAVEKEPMRQTHHDENNDLGMKNAIREKLGEYLNSKLQRRPMIIPIIKRL